MKITFIKTGKRVKTKEDGENRKTKKGEVFKTVFRKNQVVLLTLALMLVTAGYMNYNNSNNELNISLADVGDAQLVSANVTDENITVDENKIETEHEVSSNVVVNEAESNEEENVVANKVNSNVSENAVTSNVGENAITSETNSNINESTSKSNSTNQDYYTQTRLERQTMYSQMLEAYQKILENEKIPADQKTIAANEIKNINDRINAISIIENLIKTKGFEDVIILINDNNINVVVKQDNNLSQEQVAQITNIVSRELKSEIEDIHITVQK